VVDVQHSAQTFYLAPTLVGNTRTGSLGAEHRKPFTECRPTRLEHGLEFFRADGRLGHPADCPNGFSLEPGASCNLSISFIP
jgi:hypothetical protein